MKTIKRSLIILAASALTASLTSCFQSETTIHLNKDGSGTLVEETRLGAQMLAMMEQMAGLGGEADKPKEDPLKEMFSAEKAQKRATALGEGVTFDKSEKVEKDGGKGARVTYKFKDINKLKVAAGDAMSSMSPGGEDPDQKKSEPLAFNFSDGKLTIKMPEPKKVEGAKAEEKGEPSAEDLAQMKQVLGDMKMSLKIVVDSGIAGTTATHKDGNSVTLMEMDFGKLIEKPENMKKLSVLGEKDPAAAAEALNGLPGVKVETKREITIDVK